MLTKNEKKNHKNLKFKNFEKRKKKRLEKWQIGTFPQNLARIHSAVSEKTELMDRRWTLAPRQ